MLATLAFGGPKACTVGCTQCLQCIRKCPAKAIAFDDRGVIQVNHQACRDYGESCNEICVEVCPTYILHRPGMVGLLKPQEHPAITGHG